jgi:hypothetical protein
MKPALFSASRNDRIADDTSAEIFAAMATLRTMTARIADRN